MSQRGERSRSLERAAGEPFALGSNANDEAEHDPLPRRTISLIEATRTFETFSGPVPHPDLLERYERVVPGAAREFLDAVREERLHRYRGDDIEREMLKRLAEAEIRNSRLGLVFGFVIGMTGLIVACICALTDHEMTAAIVAGVDLLALVAVFVTGRVYESRRSESREPEAASVAEASNEAPAR